MHHVRPNMTPQHSDMDMTFKPNKSVAKYLTACSSGACRAMHFVWGWRNVTRARSELYKRVPPTLWSVFGGVRGRLPSVQHMTGSDSEIWGSALRMGNTRSSWPRAPECMTAPAYQPKDRRGVPSRNRNPLWCDAVISPLWDPLALLSAVPKRKRFSQACSL